MKIRIKLYTQPNCTYCDNIKSMLDQTQFNYKIINIQEDSAALEFMKEAGHTTVPQLYANSIHVNTKNTEDYTPEELHQQIADALKTEWLWIDSGIEQGN